MTLIFLRKASKTRFYEFLLCKCNFIDKSRSWNSFLINFQLLLPLLRSHETNIKSHVHCLKITQNVSFLFFFVHSKWKNCSHCSQYWMRLFLWFSNTVEPQSSGISFHSSSGWWPKFKVWIFHLFPGWQGANGTPCWLFHASPEAVLIYGPQWRQLPPKLRGQNDFAFASSQQWLQTTCQIQSYVRSRRIALWEAGAK